MFLEKTLEKLKVPKYMNLPWLTIEYIKKNGWYPVCDEWLQNHPSNFQFEDNKFFGKILWKSRDEFKPGDIVIFNEFDEWDDEDGYNTDRFLRIYKEDIEAYQYGKRDLLPVGVVVHPPKPSNSQF